MLKTPLSLFFLLSFALPMMYSAAETSDTTETAGPIYVLDEHIAKYEKFIQNKDLAELDDYNTGLPGRELVELILFHQALHLGGLKGRLKLIPHGKISYNSRLKQLAQGRFLATGYSIWHQDAQKFPDKFLLSKPIIDDGDYKVGIYTTPENTKLLAIKHLSELQKFTAVSNREWRNDWLTLKTMNIEHIQDSKIWTSHVKMLATQRADFMLMPFSNIKGLNINYNPETYEYIAPNDPSGVFLTPVPNMVVAIGGSRHFALSKAHPDAQSFFDQLELGLVILREKGLIRKALTQSGFFHPATDDWPIINQ